MDKDVLYIYGFGQSALLRPESHNSREIIFQYSDFTNLQPYFGKLATFKNLKSLTLGACNITTIRQIASLATLKNIESLDVSEENPVANLKIFRLFAIYVLTNIDTLNKRDVTLIERSAAKERFNHLKSLQMEVKVVDEKLYPQTRASNTS
jgi:hypothetical protein